MWYARSCSPKAASTSLSTIELVPKNISTRGWCPARNRLSIAHFIAGQEDRRLSPIGRRGAIQSFVVGSSGVTL
jgi:hypothetical protein